jgi:hypothetical protein
MPIGLFPQRDAEDAAKKAEKERRQKIIQDNVLMSQGKLAVNDTSRNPKPPQAPAPQPAAKEDKPERPQQQQPQAYGYRQPSIAAQHFGHHNNMIEATNNAWREEMNSRVAQNQAQAERGHEQQLAAMKAQAQQQQMDADRAQAQEASRARIQKNNAIMGMMGYPTKTVNGRKYGAFESFSNSLLGR